MNDSEYKYEKLIDRIKNIESPPYDENALTERVMSGIDASRRTGTTMPATLLCHLSGIAAIILLGLFVMENTGLNKTGQSDIEQVLPVYTRFTHDNIDKELIKRNLKHGSVKHKISNAKENL